ncbi:hypothetical protein M378DRAFT_169991 [Amanita muscaria Koide BX008]|uniref:Uncharacterized protein n=1 Tax=Amanita muscaria (strain Koide BX008) TaxID=946122 RepID=A0A0C2WC84_AMAMK|nr:hypothetical protein M378DRAFT_169991 [Amanita muscaria Koide BX008]
MDPQTTSPAAPAPPGPLAAMLHKATIDKAKGNEFNNTAGDMFKIVLNNYNATKPSESQMFALMRLTESSDAINFFQNFVLPFLAEVRKNDQSRSTVAGMAGMDIGDPVSQAVTADHTVEGDPVDLMDIVPPEPSSFVRLLHAN